MMMKASVLVLCLALASGIRALPQSGSANRPQVRSIGNGCYEVTFNSGGGSSSSTICGEGTPRVNNIGNGCYSVTLGGSSSTVCASGNIENRIPAPVINRPAVNPPNTIRQPARSGNVPTPNPPRLPNSTTPPRIPVNNTPANQARTPNSPTPPRTPARPGNAPNRSTQPQTPNTPAAPRAPANAGTAPARRPVPPKQPNGGNNPTPKRVQ
ncbi:hypothetical protein BKA69DRAFT_1038597 [Paraphysoderma sedebokerense]|nr:hypothetical protein BKA69DRAFT_1038597 [Paraphysoderma sedebokerense]